jgi:hypothetical protein
MDQQWHETKGREQEWMADQLQTPWAVKLDPGAVKILDRNGSVVAKMVMGDDQTAALAAGEIIGLVNSQY